MTESSARTRAAARIELPDLPAILSVDRHHRHRRRRRVEDSVDDDGIALHLGVLEGIAAVVGPGDLKPADIRAIDLCERRVAAIALAAVDRPIDVVRLDGEHQAAEQSDADAAEDERLHCLRAVSNTGGA